ncbi:MAG TPA: hypothetical protein VKU94_01345, partial [Geobacterales bacterium]|nr:hypothetical protein [Geobacterales bacterium]
MGKTRIFFVSDIHGSDKLYLKFLNAAKVYGAQVLIIGGDIAGKALVPVFKKGNSFEAEVKGNVMKAENEEKLVEIKRAIRSQGDYPIIIEKEEWQELLRDKDKLDRIFLELIKENMIEWCRLAEERLKPLGTKIIINTGNDDPKVCEEVLKESDFVIYPNEKIIWVDEYHEMLSLGYSNPTPWNLPGDLPEEILESKIDSLVSSAREARRMIFNIHVPPFNTHLDIAPKLDQDLRPVLTPGGEPEFTHVGSIAVRKAIEKYQPFIGLHGHIHESKGYT